MAKDPKGEKGAAEFQEETLQIRVKKKNPLIERKVIEQDEVQTSAGVAPLSIYDRIEASVKTEEIDVEDIVPASFHTERPIEVRTKARPEPRPAAPHARRAAKYLDEDETIVADGPPQTPAELEREQDRLLKSRQATVKDGALEPITDEGPMLEGVLTPPDPTTRPASPAAGAVPKGTFGILGTDAAGAAVHRAMIEKADRTLPKARAPALKLVRAELDAEEIVALDDALAGKFEIAGTDGSISPKRCLEHLVNERTYNELTPKERAILLKGVAQDPRDVATTKAAIALLKTGLPTRLKDQTRRDLLSTFLAFDSESRALLAQLTVRQLRGRSALEDRDFQDAGLIDHLRAFAFDPLAAPLQDAGARKPKLWELALNSMANPKRMSFEEGANGVLGMLEFALAESSPAEHLRIWRALVTGDLTAELAGKKRLDLRAALQDRTDLRFSARETPVRLAFEQLGSGPRARGAKAHRSNFIMPGGLGVDADVISRALEQIYGVGFTVAAGAKTALRHLERVEREPQRVPPVLVSILYQRGERLFVFDHLDEHRVYLRAPHGRSSKRKGATRADPAREVIDPDLSIDAISIDAFSESVGVGLIPRP